MTNISTIKVDINNPAPSSYEVYSHELNYGLTRFIEVEFLSNSQPLDFTNVTITASIVCNGYLVAEDIAVTSVIDNKVKMLISSTAQYTILDGLMYIEFKFKEGNTELYPPTPIVIDVKPSIRDNAKVTPESYGTVSEILQEVAEARGTYNSLGARLDSIDVDSILPIGETDISDGAVTNGKIYTGAVTGDKIDGRTITGDKLALATVDTSELANFSVDTMKLKSPSVNTAKLYDNAVTADKILDGEVKTNKIADNAINGDKIQPDAVGMSQLNCYITSGNASQAWAFANDTTIPTTKLTKTWIENYTVDMLPSYSIGFNTDGIAVQKTTSTIMGAGTFLSGIKSIYLSENVTALQDGFFETARDLTDLYVDSHSVQMPTVPARVTVHNKGTFKVSDLLIDSMVASNNEIADIKATIIQVNTMLENAINGVRE